MGDERKASAVPPQIWKETIQRLGQHGQELLDSRREMYLATIQEGRTREAEDSMTAHLPSTGSSSSTSTRVLTPERMQRLNVFRVKKYYEQVDETIASLK